MINVLGAMIGWLGFFIVEVLCTKRMTQEINYPLLEEEHVQVVAHLL
jgi:glycopeptide antibiotics resistance protein